MDLTFIRHGEPAWSVDGLSQLDPYLTELGHEQAKLAAARLAQDDRGFTEIIVSPARRSQQTAAPIAEALGLEPVTIDNIVEIKMPDWAGAPEAEVQKIFHDAQSRPEEEWWEGLPGGESFRDFHNRIVTAMDKLLAERGVVSIEEDHLWRVDDPTQRILVVAHGGTNSVALGHVLNLQPTPWEWERLLLRHASLARTKTIELAGAHTFSLRSFNDTQHLPREMQTR